MKLVVGLGNPGSQYARTRHNVGWLVVDRLADRAGWAGRGRQRDASNVVGGHYRGLDLTLVKPLTTNDSDPAVRKVLARERAPLSDLLVIADDFALPFGKLRFREGGGPGGHRLPPSSTARHGEFSRLRIGIGSRPGRRTTSCPPSRPTRRSVSTSLDAAADAVEAWAREGRTRPPTGSACSTRGRHQRLAAAARSMAARFRWRASDAHGLAPDPARQAGRLTMPDTPLRGRRGRDRRIAERVATDFAARHAPPSPDSEIDFDVAEVDAEVADARRAPVTPKPAARPPAAAGTDATAARKGSGQRLPDLSAAAAPRRHRHVRHLRAVSGNDGDR